MVDTVGVLLELVTPLDGVTSELLVAGTKPPFSNVDFVAKNKLNVPSFCF